MKNKVNLCSPDLSLNELNIVKKVFKDGSVSHGKYISLFENKFSELLSVKHAIAVNSCTSGLYCLALYYKNIYHSGEVLVPSFTWNATVNSIVNAGLRPVFLDIDFKKIDVTLEEIKKKYSKKTIGIMLVHYAGRANQEISAIAKFAKKKKLFLIEDCAETLNTLAGKKKTGSFGHGVFSFYGTKNITTGEGGIISTNSDDINNWLRKFIAHGVVKGSYGKKPYPWNRNAVIAGQNFRLSNLQAAIGYVQIQRSNQMHKKRVKIANRYYKFLSKLEQYIHLPIQLKDNQNSYQMFPIIIKNNKIRNKFVKYLNSNGIGASVHFDPPVHKQTAYQTKKYNLPNTEYLSSSVVTLPISSVQNLRQTNLVIKYISKFFLHYR